MSASKPRAVLVYKRTALQAIGGRRSAAWRLVPEDTRRALAEADEAHHRCMGDVMAALKAAHIEVRERYRGDVRRRLKADLVITVGGDGTLLGSAGYVRNELVLAVNSDPRHSVGVFTGANGRNVRERIAGWMAGDLKPVALPRMLVTVNHKPIRWPVLNEVLLADANPAAMTRYRMRVRGREEEHRGSGLWVATGPGSTGAIRSAGGRILPMRSKQIEFLARELYPSLRGKPKLGRGVVGANGFSVIALTRNGALFCDGSRRRVTLKPGDVVRFSLAAPPLQLLGLDPSRRKRPWQ